MACACRRPPHEEDELLKQALLGADVEAPASSKKKPWCGHHHKLAVKCPYV